MKSIFRKRSFSGFLRTRQLRSLFDKSPLVIDSLIENVCVKFHVHTWVEYHNRALVSYSGEPDMVEFLKTNIHKDDIIWDIGANVGAYSLLAAKINGSCAKKVVSFEPYIPTFAHLWENIVLNDCTDRVIPLCVALTDKSSLDFLGISNVNAGSSEHIIGDDKLLLIQPCIVMKGDDINNYLDIPSPSILKIDVDGFEVNVLKGMQDILGNKFLRGIIVEVERGKTEGPVTTLLQNYGFSRDSDSYSLSESLSFNVVFSRLQ